MSLNQFNFLFIKDLFIKLVWHECIFMSHHNENREFTFSITNEAKLVNGPYNKYMS